MHDAGLHQIDFLSLDVEGGELDVLSTVSPASFRLVMVEEELMVSTRETICLSRRPSSDSSSRQREIRSCSTTDGRSLAPLDDGR